MLLPFSCSSANALLTDHTGNGWGSEPMRINQHIYADFPVEIRTDVACHPHVTGAHLVGAEADTHSAVYAVDRTDGSQIGTLGIADDDDLQETEPSIRLHPITDAVFGPGQDQR